MAGPHHPPRQGGGETAHVPVKNCSAKKMQIIALKITIKKLKWCEYPEQYPLIKTEPPIHILHNLKAEDSKKGKQSIALHMAFHALNVVFPALNFYLTTNQVFGCQVANQWFPLHQSLQRYQLILGEKCTHTHTQNAFHSMQCFPLLQGLLWG